MDVTTIERWIMNLGRPYDALVAEGIIPNMPLQGLYPGRDWLDIQPASGLELSFWAETKRFERLFITLISTMEGTTEYKGELPSPFASVMFQASVRNLFGEPMESKGPTKLPLNTMVGGFDIYRLDPAKHPNIKVSFQYTPDMQVKTLVFSLINREH
ncbi:DUF6392 family protein [Pseudomonas indica]|uniref:DUF6392 family protein n=1 Tax=Pseudomonas indica TaxID=137658 RepID=UPI0023F6F01A|nr:DUF6392 family protein [Pseudomonas indica]MBU3055798.1 hypothetical protein [Pseudomonas indica]